MEATPRLCRLSSNRRDWSLEDSGTMDSCKEQESLLELHKSKPHRLLSVTSPSPIARTDGRAKRRAKPSWRIVELIYKHTGGVVTAAGVPEVNSGDGVEKWTRLPSFPYHNMHILGFSNGMLLMVESVKPPFWNMVTFEGEWLQLVVWDVKQGKRLKTISIPKTDVIHDGDIPSLVIDNNQLSVVNFAVVGKQVELDMVLCPSNMVQEAWVLGRYKFTNPGSGIYLRRLSDCIALPSHRLGKWVACGGFLYVLAYNPPSDSMQLFHCVEPGPGYAPSIWKRVLGSKELEADCGYGKLQSLTMLNQNGSLLLLYRTSTENGESSSFRIVKLELTIRRQGKASYSIGHILAEAPSHLMSWISCFEEKRPMEWHLVQADEGRRCTIHITLSCLKQQLVCDLSQTPPFWRLISSCTGSLPDLRDLYKKDSKRSCTWTGDAKSRYFTMPLQEYDGGSSSSRSKTGGASAAGGGPAW